MAHPIGQNDASDRLMRISSSEWDEDDLIQYLDQHIVASTERLVQKFQDWSEAIDYYNGIIPDMIIKQPGQSETVSRDVRSTIRKLLPVFIRSLFKKGNIVKFMPKSAAQVGVASDITKYINKVAFPKSKGDDALHDATFDALLLGAGILKWEVGNEYRVAIQQSDPMPTEIAMSLVDSLNEEDRYNILGANETPDGQGVVLTVREYRNKKYLRLRSIPRRRFIIDPEATCIEDAIFVGEFDRITRSELVSMGVDKDLAYSIGASAADAALNLSGLWNNVGVSSMYADPGKNVNDGNETDFNSLMSNVSSDASSEKVLYYNLYVKLDIDGDGISEIYNVWLLYGETDEDPSANLSGRNYSIAKFELVEEIPYSVLRTERIPYAFEGKPIADDVMPIQRIKTTFLRESIDNMRLQTVPITYIDISRVKNPRDLFNRRRGKPIILKPGSDARQVISEYRPEFIGDRLQNFLNYMDFVLKDRTGITDMTGGVEPEKLQHMPATNAQILSEGGTIQGDVMFRTLTLGGVREAFNGLYRLTLRNPDLIQNTEYNMGDDKFQTFDPSGWDPDIECSVVASIGGGSKALDINNAMTLMGLQEKLSRFLGQDNPFVKPQNLSNLLAHITELMGYPTPGVFFSEPTEEEIQALYQKQEEAKQEEDNREIRKEQMKIQARSDIERVQMQADVIVQREKMESDKEVKLFESVLKEKIKRLEVLASLKEHNDEMEMEYNRLLVEIEKMESDALRDIDD